MPYSIHEYLRRARLSREGATTRPHTLPRGIAKEYPRMRQISLPHPETLAMQLEMALARRSSDFSRVAAAPLPLSTLGTLLGHALRSRPGGKKRPYPSGGALFPIETYLCGSIGENNPAVYHYQPLTHALEYLWDMPRDAGLDTLVPGHPDAPRAPLCILLTARWDRTCAEYGDFGYLLGVLEAGHLAQNMLLVGTALNLVACPVEGFRDDVAGEWLDIDASREQPVYALLIGTGARDYNHEQ